MDWLFNIHLITGWLPKTMIALTVAGIVMVVVLKSSTGWFKPLLTQLAWGVAGLAVGGLVIWLLSDVFKVFGVSLGWKVMLTIAVGIAVITALAAAAVQSRGARRVMAVITVVLALLTCLLRVDSIYGEYTTLGSVFGHTQFSPLDLSKVHKNTTTVEAWKAEAEKGALPIVPKKGEVHSITIPSSDNRFRPRTANVYLPPAALSDNPPALPVMIVLAGQPGSPDRYFTAGQLGVMLNNYAAKHQGLAPIAVSPDQNGSLTRNTLCADTPEYGNAETYLVSDVTRWVKQHLPVQHTADAWLIGGFSQGGTCATQLGPAYPHIYGHIFSAGGEIEPTVGSHEKTVDEYFDKDEAKFDRHVPIKIIKRHAPSTQTWFSIAGQWDQKSQKNQTAISTAAMDAGMRTTTVISQGTGHDWHTVQNGMLAQIDLFGTQTGLGKTHRNIKGYSKIKVVTANTNQYTD
ncbi:Putative esterase [Bifidobacterium bohemicum]|uniref:Putative esterase n=1 Tax=Bifidobacterium bohemicum DSM 22767 TaxID=1437606 RepID=A0A086ZFY6_9BIFI|nr:alpha/beta hydrolase-fold protein [Bifidobacterium bohemicum]KFI45436.1 putative esterase [Bifidobacterium bohemicum DSM 22767]SCB72969.1 Putative esterase [Bifidobacterium bohemicum]